MSRIIQKINFLKRKLNFLDLSFIILLFLVLGFFTYNRLQRQSTWVNIRISVENPDWWYRGSPPNYWYASDLKVGDEVKDTFGVKVAEVVAIDNYDAGGPYRDIYVDLKVKVDFNKNKDQYLYEFKPLVVGSSLLFNFPQEQLRGLVIRVNQEEIKYSYKTIKVEKKMVLPYLANQVKIGTKSTDLGGKLIAEIVGVNEKVSARREFSDIRGQNIQVYNEDYRDLEVTLRVKAFSDLNRDFYINKSALKIGSSIWLQFPEFALEDARIVEVID